MGIQDREYYQGEEPGLGFDLRRQSMITNLIIINVAVFLANMFTSSPAHPDWLMYALASKPENLTHPLQWWHFLTAGFAHAPNNLMHLLFNMAGLFFLGRDVEQKMGKREFLAFYLLVIVVTSMLSALRYNLMVPKADWPDYSLGASGAVVAVVILFAFYFPKRQLLLMFLIPLPAWAAAVLFVLLEIFAVDPVSTDGSKIAHDVHLAGAAMGALYYLSGIKLTTWWPKLGGRRKPRLRVLRADNDEELEREGDRLLEKVHREGEESLTPRERRVLEKYSRLLRQRQGD